jgi:hypothetical protein
VRRGNINSGWAWRGETGHTTTVSVDWSQRRRLDGRERSQDQGADLSYTTRDDDSAAVYVNRASDSLAVAFEPLDGLIVQPGRFRTRGVGAEFGSSSARVWSALVGFYQGGYFQGRQREIYASLKWRPDERWAAFGDVSQNRIRYPQPGSAERRFIARTLSAGVEYTPSIAVSGNAVVSYDNQSRQWGLSLRSRWEPTARTEVAASLDRLQATLLEPAQRFASVRLSWRWDR